MYRICTILAFLLTALPAAAAPVDPTEKPPEKKKAVIPNDKRSPAAREFQEIMQEYMHAMMQHQAGEVARREKKEQPKGKADEKLLKPPVLCTRLLRLARHYPKDPVALEALLQVARQGTGAQRNKAYEQLARDHADNVKVASLLWTLQTSDSPAAEKLLDALRSAPNRDTRGRAHLFLGRYLARKADHVERLKGGKDADLEQRLTDELGQEAVKQLKATDPAKIRRQAEGVFEETAKNYAGVKTPEDDDIGERAKGALEALRKKQKDGQ